MRIFNSESNQVFDEILLILNEHEILQLKVYLENLLRDSKLHHVHMDDIDDNKEITIAIYTGDNLAEFDERSQEVILHNK